MDIRRNHRAILLLRAVSVRFNAAIIGCRALWFYRLSIYGPFMIGPESQHRMQVMLPTRECAQYKTCTIKDHYYPKTLVPQYTTTGNHDEIDPYKIHMLHENKTYVLYLRRQLENQRVILKRIQNEISRIDGKIKTAQG
jgi:hypothetical protein